MVKVLKEGTYHADASERLEIIRKWNSAFYGVSDAIEDVSNFLASGDAHKGDENYLFGIFNSMEILKSTVGLDDYQKSLCNIVYDKLVQLAGHDF